MLEATTLQAEREKREAIEFIAILRTLSEREKGRVQGYMECLRTVKIPENSREKSDTVRTT